jgi:DNA-binding MarR family transcriptional regulator
MEPLQPVTQDSPLSAEEEQDFTWFTRLEREFPALYRRTRTLLTENAHAIHPDLEGAGYVLLVQIHQRAPIRAAQLVEHVSTDKSAISRQVRLLFDLKLIDRVADPNDSRAYLLVLTEEGARRIDQSQSTRLQQFRAFFPHISEALKLLLLSDDDKDDEAQAVR